MTGESVLTDAVQHGMYHHNSALERDQNIALLKTIRGQLLATIELCQRYDTSLAYEFGKARASVDERLANLLLARELSEDRP